MTSTARGMVRKFCEKYHPSAVLAVVEAYCLDQAVYCDATPDLKAIAAEWRQAAQLIEDAANVIEP